MHPGDKTLLPDLESISDELNNPQVTDIVVNRPGRVGVKHNGIWKFRDEPALTFNVLDRASILIGYRTGKEFDEEHPYLNSTLPDGQRHQSVRPPGTQEGRILWAIRRPPSVARRIDDDDFEGMFTETNMPSRRKIIIERKTYDLYKEKNWTEFFRSARLAGMSVACCGPTNSGKSDFIRRLLQIYRLNTRIVTIQTDDEFGDIGPENKASLLFDEGKISSDEAVKVSLRLTPNEIFYQEVRGAEAYSLMRAMSTGHAGGATSWHAEEGRELIALAHMARMHPAGREMSDEKLMELMKNLFDIIVYCESDGNKFMVSSVKFLAAERN